MSHTQPQVTHTRVTIVTGQSFNEQGVASHTAYAYRGQLQVSQATSYDRGAAVADCVARYRANVAAGVSVSGFQFR